MLSHRKRILLFGGILLLVAGWFTFNPLNTPKASAAALNGCPEVLSLDPSSPPNPLVAALQFRLNRAYELSPGPGIGMSGFPFPLSTDGSFGPLTEDAVVAFQNYVGIGASGNGQVGYRTWSALGFCQAGWNPDEGFLAIPHRGVGTYCPPEVYENDANGPWNAVLQDLINFNFSEGLFTSTSYPGASWTPYLASDGSFGPQTYGAVENFQYNAGLGVDGDVGPNTWGALNMCY